MFNKDIFNKSYKHLLTNTEGLDELHKALDYSKLGNNLIYIRNNRNKLYYLIAYYLSVKADKVLTKAIITGQTYIDQHFMNEGKDRDLYEDVRYADITFVSLSQADYNNQYLENLLIELVEFRNNLGKDKKTIITFDVIDSSNYLNTSKKLKTFFENNFSVLYLTDGARLFDAPSMAGVNQEEVAKQVETAIKTRRKGRIK